MINVFSCMLIYFTIGKYSYSDFFFSKSQNPYKPLQELYVYWGSMFISVFLAGVIAYMISCKLRKKIVLTTFIVLIIACIDMIIRTNIIIFEKNMTMLELMSLSMGAMGVYLLMISLLLIPLSIITWLIARFIRNVKERKNPLLCLEGSCDL